MQQLEQHLYASKPPANIHISKMNVLHRCICYIRTCPSLERDEGSELHWVLAEANRLLLTGTLTKLPGNPFSVVDFLSMVIDLVRLVLSLVSTILVASTFLVD